MNQRTDEELKATEKKWEFTSLGKYQMLGRGDVFSIRCPIKCYAFDWLINKPAIIDGKEWTVIAVERFMKAGPINKDEPIGLLVNSMDYAILNTTKGT